MDGGKGGGQNRDEIRGLIDIEQNALRRAGETSAAFNFFDVTTPFGSQQFFGRPGTDEFRQQISLDPAEQQLLEQRRGALGLLGGFGLQQAQQAGDIFGAPILGGQDLAQSAQGLEQATFQRGSNLLQPNFREDRQRLENQLLARGIPRDSEAFRSEIRRLDQSQNQALENLALSSVGAGREEQSRLLQSDLARRAGTIGEIQALAGGPTSTPTFQPTPNIMTGAPNVGNAIGFERQRQGQQQQAANAALGGLFDIGTSVLLGF